MRLDYDLIRTLLLLTEEHSNGICMLIYADYEKWLPDENTEKLWYHLKYLIDAELVEYEPYHITDITPKGRDYLDSIREPTIWSKAKEKASYIGRVSFELLVHIAKDILLSSLEK